MTFSSATFLFAFLPLFLGLYFLLRGRRARNVWLFIGSVFFYAWGEPVYVGLMLVSIAANWFLALRVAAARTPARKTCLLAVACVFNILVIGFFKYESFLAGIVNQLVGRSLVPDLHLPLPIGISFYTLQALAYVIDVHRVETKPQRDILSLGMYIVCFPQLIAGPIVRYRKRPRSREATQIFLILLLFYSGNTRKNAGIPVNTGIPAFTWQNILA